ncbi:MAG: RidA family protein [Chloroflexota bacterium]
MSDETTTGRIGERLRELGIDLPAARPPLGSYVPAKRVGNIVTTSGQIPSFGGTEYKGHLGADLSPEDARAATRACALNCLAALLTVVDSLDRVQQIVSLHGFVNSAPDADGHAAAMNGASDLMVEIFGEAGKHARSTVGVAALPGNFAAQVYMVVEVS